jgi:hypothetical protein
VSFLVLVMAAAVASGGAPTQPPAAGQPTSSDSMKVRSEDKAASDLDKLECRTEPVTGSRFTRRVCMTQSQWSDMARNAERVERQRNEHVQMGGIGAN